jgi:hypothetical protein
VSDRNIVVWEVQFLKNREHIFLYHEGVEGVKLHVQFYYVGEVGQLLYSHFVVGQIQEGEVLEVAQVFFNHLYNVLPW